MDIGVKILLVIAIVLSCLTLIENIHSKETSKLDKIAIKIHLCENKNAACDDQMKEEVQEFRDSNHKLILFKYN